MSEQQPTPDQPDEPIEAAGAGESDETLAVPLAALRPAIEAMLMVSDQPMDEVTLASAVGYPVPEVVTALAELAREYDDTGRGFELRNVAGGWRYYTREEFAPVVERFVLEGQQARLTQAALETLSVVAYKQPVSRSRVSAIRGVNVDGVMRTLLTRGLVEEAGTDDETGAHLYRTSSYFLERIGINSIEELPELAPFLPEMDDPEFAADFDIDFGGEPAQSPSAGPEEPAAQTTAPTPEDAPDPDASATALGSDEQ